MRETQSTPEVWAILEHDGTALSEYSGELLAQLVEAARRQPEVAAVCAVLLSAPDMPLPDLPPIVPPGIARLYVVSHPALAQYRTEAWVSALAWMVRERAPLLVATGATANGRDWMPRLAARLRLTFAPGCLSIDIQDDALIALRPIYEGRAYVQTRSVLNGRTALATLLMGMRGKPVTVEGKSVAGQELAPAITTLTPVVGLSDLAGEMAVGAGVERGGAWTLGSPSLTRNDVDPVVDDAGTLERVRHVAMQAPSPEEVELEAAERIVAGGRGVGPQGFASVAEFARLLGAAVGATRVATDRAWVEHARQIGATGKSVHPRLYIACGISGAAQHTSGMREAQTVIAINPDRTAPIFALADLGLLGDANQVLPLAAKMIGSTA